MPVSDRDLGDGRGTAILVQATALMGGLQFAFLTPALALYLTTVFGATEAQIGLVLALNNASGFVAALVIPGLADRRGQYLGVMAICGAVGVVLATALAAAGSLPFVAAVLALLGGPAGAGGMLLFAHLSASGYSNSAMMSTRAMVSLAWVGGPPLAMLLARLAGIRSLLVAMAVVAASNVVLVLILRRRLARPVAKTKSAEEPSSALPIGRLVVVTLGFVLLQATNATMTSMMALFATRALGLDAVWGGIALALAAFLEVPALLILGRLCAHHRPLPLLVVGIVAAAAYFFSIAFIDGVVGLLAVQVLNAWFVASVQGIGLTWFMEIIPRPGIATGVFSNSYRMGAILSGGIVVIAGTPSGYAGMFLVCAALATIALVLIVASGRQGPAQVETGR